MSNKSEIAICIEQICANIKSSPHELDYGGMKISVKPYLNRAECSDFVYNIAMYLLERYSDTGSLVWADRIIRAFTILTYTNIGISEYLGNMSKCDEEDILIPLVYETPIYAQMVGTEQKPQYFRGVAYTKPLINVEQFNSLVDAAYATLNKWLSITVNQLRVGAEHSHEEA